MIETDAEWMNTVAQKLSGIDFAIVACIIGFVFFMKFNRHESKNKANLVISVFLGLGFLMLVGFRFYQGS